MRFARRQDQSRTDRPPEKKVRTYLCMYLCLYVCIHVSMYVYVYVYMYQHIMALHGIALLSTA